MDAILIIDKPSGMTSHDVVNRVRRITGERAVGHLGTLDPMATGVLPLVLGRMTRLAQFYTGAEKSYEGEIRFGFATDTYDAEGEPVSGIHRPELDLEAVRGLATKFVGVIEQVPPPFSAKKIRGVPAYRMARRQEPVELGPVQVEVREFEILGVKHDRASFRARVASGTYLRSIAHSMGQQLKTGAHLASLRRTAVAEFNSEQACSLDRLEATCTQCPITDIMLTSETVSCFLHPRSILPQFPAVTATEEALPRLLHGNTVNLADFSKSTFVKVFRGQHELVAIAKRVAGALFHPKVVLAQAGPVAAAMQR